jgi:hypothetical protein
MTPTIALFILAFAIFVAAAANLPSRVNLVGAGLAVWVLAQIVALLVR